LSHQIKSFIFGKEKHKLSYICITHTQCRFLFNYSACWNQCTKICIKLWKIL